MFKLNKKIVQYAVAVVGTIGIIYLIYEENILATVGKFVLTWLARSWELLVRVAEFLWRPLVLLGEGVIRALMARPFGKLFAWFVAGYILHYIMHPDVRAKYDNLRERLFERGSQVREWWMAIPLLYRVLIIVGGAAGVAVFHVGLLLLPLGFFVEPVIRRIYRWFAQQRLEQLSLAKRFNNAVYRHTRVAMRKSPVFRRGLGPFRAIRLRGIRQSRVLHYQYRAQGKSAADMVRDMRLKKHERADKNQPGSQ